MKIRTSKLYRILAEIEMGKRNNVYDLDLTLEEYLYTIDGISFLEHLLKAEVSISVLEKTLINSIEAGYLYSKYNKSLYLFEYTEEDLFFYIDGKRFVDLLIEQNSITPNMIESVKNNLEIVDLLSKKSPYKLIHLSEEIKEKLITKQSNGIYPIEKYIKEELVMETLIQLYDNPKAIIEICAKYNRDELLAHLNEKSLMYELYDNYTICDKLLEQNIIPKKFLSIAYQTNYDEGLLNFIRKRELYKYLKNANEKILLSEDSNGKTILEELLQRNLITEIKSDIKEEKTLNILNRLNRLEFLTSVYSDILMKPANDVFNLNIQNKNVYEYLLSKGCKVKYFLSKNTQEEDIIKFLYNLKEFDLIGKSFNGRNLFYEIEEGIPLIDKLLEENADIQFGYEGIPQELLPKLYKYDRLDLLMKTKVNILLNNMNDKETYLDYILECIKSKKCKNNLDALNFFDCNVNHIARFYLALAKHDMIVYVDRLGEKRLLEEFDGKTLIEELLDIDSDLTINKIIQNDVKANIKIAIILKSRGIEQEKIDIPLENKNFVQDYLEKEKRGLGIGPLQMEGQYLLEKLYDLFMHDSQSEPSLVESLILAYRQALIIDYNKHIKELRNLVKIKEQNKHKFVYLKSEDGAYFRPNYGSVFLENIGTDTILHETGHALHSYLVDSQMPEFFENTINKIRQNPDNLIKVEEFSNKVRELIKNVEEMVKMKYEKVFENYYTEDKIQEIKEFLQKTKEEKKEEFKDLGLSDEVLDIILDNIFTCDEYIEQQKRILISEHSEAVFRTEYGSLMAICDILDAIYEGELYSAVLENSKGEKIQKVPGHGISYYVNSPEKRFNEMVANFAAISKSKYSYEMLEKLRYLIGDELYDLLNKFYYDYISNLDKETPVESMHI